MSGVAASLTQTVPAAGPCTGKRNDSVGPTRGHVSGSYPTIKLKVGFHVHGPLHRKLGGILTLPNSGSLCSFPSGDQEGSHHLGNYSLPQTSCRTLPWGLLLHSHPQMKLQLLGHTPPFLDGRKNWLNCVNERQCPGRSSVPRNAHCPPALTPTPAWAEQDRTAESIDPSPSGHRSTD